MMNRTRQPPEANGVRAGRAVNQATVGRLRAIWVKRAHRGPMDATQHAMVRAGRGLAQSVAAGPRRQLTIIAYEVWQRMMAELGADLDPAARRANLMVSGIQLQESRGRTLRVGDIRIRIGGETRPCERMDEALPGLREVMTTPWHGGAYGEALDDGAIRVGDEVCWLDE